MNLPDPSGPSAAAPLRILQLEDSADDAELVLAQLRRDGLAFTCRRVDTRADFIAALEDFKPQIVIADYKLPAFDGGSALALVLERHPQIPVIMVSGALGDEAAVELLRQGARDFVLKDRMGRLGAAVRNALVESAERTRRQQAEQALQDSEQRFRSLIESTSDIIGIARPDGTILYVSPAAREVSGYDPQELVGRNYFDFVPPEELELAHSQVATLMSQPGQPVHLEGRVRHKDGSVRHIETVARNLAQLPGIEGIVVNIRDVTPRKNAEARLRLANLLIEQSPSVLFRWSATPGWPVVYVSDNVRQWGYAPGDLLGGKLVYAELIHPDDRARVADEVTAYSASGVARFAQEYRIVRPSGEVIWVDDRTTVERDLAGVPVFFQGVVMDITARKSAEQALRDNEQTLRTITGAAMDAVIVMDNDGRIAFWNEAAERHLGFSRSQALGQELHMLMAPERYREGFRKAFAHFRASGQGPFIGRVQELDALRADGTEVPVELSISAVQLKGRWCAVGILRDISERRRAEAERQALLDRARAQLAAVTQITASPALAAGEVETLAREITELAAGVSGAERANAWLFNDDETELHCIDLYEATPARHSSGMVLKQSEFENEFRALKAAPFVDADDALSDPRTAGYVETYLKPLRITSMLDTVIQVGGQHLGLLCIEHVDRAHHWAPDEIAFAGQLADRLGLCLLNRSRRELTTELQEAQRMSLMGNWRLDAATGKLTWSEELYRIFGLDPARPAPPLAEPILTPESDLRLRERIRVALTDGTPYCEDVSLVHPQLGLRWITARGEAQRDAAGTIVALRGTVQDITERRLQEAVLRRTARALKALSRGNSALVHAQSEQQLYEDMCRAIVETGGYRMAWVGLRNGADTAVRPVAQAGTGLGCMDLAAGPGDSGFCTTGAAAACVATGELQLCRDIDSDPRMEPCRQAALDAGVRAAIALPLKDAAGVAYGALCIYTDDPADFDAEELPLLAEMAGNLAYGIASLRTRAAQRAADEQVRVLARFPAENPNAVMRLDRDGVLLYANPASAALRAACGARVGEVAPEPCCTLAREAFSSAAIREEEIAFGERLFALTFAPVAEAGYVNLYGVDVTARRHAEQRLHQALVATVESIAATMEMRDPYTAGHQRRVAALAAAIATEMGLPTATVEGIHFGALIHDLGKIQIPAEILAKPARLSVLEMELIQTHPQAGYDILKGIAFPWPVALMVLQHHERLDGSGYPQGLKGDQICLEARILGVADVVEAMSSHRPYRPGIGIDAALEEIGRQKGALLDAAAVDACLRLFRDKRFKLQNE